MTLSPFSSIFAHHEAFFCPEFPCSSSSAGSLADVLGGESVTCKDFHGALESIVNIQKGSEVEFRLAKPVRSCLFLHLLSLLRSFSSSSYQRYSTDTAANDGHPYCRCLLACKAAACLQDGYLITRFSAH